MRIYCPKCNAGYEIDGRQIADGTRLLKCSNCGEIFAADELLFGIENTSKEQAEDKKEPFELLHAAMSEEAEEPFVEESSVIEEKDSTVGGEQVSVESVSEEVTAAPDFQSNGNAGEETDDSDEEENVDLEKIFERLSEHTSRLLDEEKKLPFYAKVWLQIKNILGFHFKIKWGYVAFCAAVFVLLSMFNNRYQIVREVPFLNAAYKFFGIEAKIPGEGLEFQNISWEFLNDDEGPRLEIKGFVYNQTDKNIELPLVHIELLDRNTVLLQSHNRNIEEPIAEAQAKIPLDLVIPNPAPTAKYVYLTFVDGD